MYMEKSYLLEGIVDMHVHAGPSVANRSVDAIELFRMAEDAGYRGVVVKDHYFPSILGTRMIQDHLAKGTTSIWGSACLNNSTGIVNPYTVDIACAMGAKVIWFPTLSANRHIENHKGKGKFAGAGTLQLQETPFTHLNDDGSLKSEVKEALAVLATYPDVVMGAGHASVAELDVLIPAAFEAGIKKVVVDHPYLIIGASVEDSVRWSKLGAYIELTAGVFETVGMPHTPNLPLSIVTEYLDKIDINQLFIVSDSGQAGAPDPITVMYRFLCGLLDKGVSEEAIARMTKHTPAMLLNLD